MPSNSLYIDAELARRAVALALPAIEAALQDEAISGQHLLHLVVLNPARTPAECSFGEALLHEQTVGRLERLLWDADYAALAREKAELSWRHGMDSRRLQLLEPHRLREGDSPLWGGVCLQGIVVAASGAMPEWDEAFSLAVAAHLRALAWRRAQARAG